MSAPAAAVLTVIAIVVVPPDTAAAAGSQPVYSYADAIRETVWVGTGADVERDGRSDRVAADIVVGGPDSKRLPGPTGTGQPMSTSSPTC